MTNTNMNEIIEQAEQNIRTAIKDYRRYTWKTKVLDEISDEFIYRLAEDSFYAKQELRNLFSKSPAWVPELDSLVINGTRTHDMEPQRIWDLGGAILRPAMKSGECSFDTYINILNFFAAPENEQAQKYGIESINKIAPNAYAPGKKLSRIFKAICVALGIADETAGSEFQKLYAQFADELSAKKIDFKLFVSINPAHFLTMSNPKNDKRGDTLTSCHSLNSTEYQYNNGCTGYARDKYSFIVFTAADPDNPETLNNRKTTRQVFAYKPGNGVLLQSRFYNTHGGTTGAVEASAVYRDLIQRELSLLEGIPNLWKTKPAIERPNLIEIGEGFGGYPDWIYSNFNAKISIRTGYEDTCKPFTVGAAGLCINCGCIAEEGLYCDDCDESKKNCGECGCRCDSNDMHAVIDGDGDTIYVCDYCFDNDYTYCDACDHYHPNSYITYVEDEDENYCDDCLVKLCEKCDKCGEYHLRDNMKEAVNSDGDDVYVCKDCIENEDYIFCEDCGRYVHSSNATSVIKSDGTKAFVCPSCLEDDYTDCLGCGRYFEDEALVSRLCPECREDEEELEDVI